MPTASDDRHFGPGVATSLRSLTVSGTHPVSVGTGKRLFADGTRSATWKLVKSRVGDAGVIIATYEPA